MRDREIVFCLRHDFEKHSGGDVVQMRSWEKALLRLGNRVRILSGAVQPADLRDADVVFIWHLDRLHESFQPWNVARQMNRPVVLAPTCWYNRTPGRYRAVVEQLKIWGRWLRFDNDPAVRSMLFRSWRAGRDLMLRQSSLLLVNSAAEKALLRQDGAEEARLRIIPNIVETAELAGISRLPWNERDGIVCVGHFCPRKNQLGLIRAVKGTALKITFVGTARPMHQRYWRRCLADAGGQHEFTGELSHPEVLALLARSRVIICSSFSETPGIGNLEAAALGCSLVLPDLAPIREYFNGSGIYIDPEKIDPEKIVTAFHTEPSPEMADRILNNYTERNIITVFDHLQFTGTRFEKNS